jgi:hypothetical protein
MSAEPRRPRRRGTPISESLGADLQALGGTLASHTRGLDAYLNRQAQRIDQRHHNLLAEPPAVLLPPDLQLDRLSKTELQALCRQHRLRGWSRLRHPNLLAFVTQHLQSAPSPAPAEAPAAIDTSDASRSERLLLLLLDQLGVAPEAVQAAWRGDDGGGETGGIHSKKRGAG